MKRFNVLNLIISILFLANNLNAQIGYYDSPYTRYEADLGTLSNAAVIPQSYSQSALQSEASGQVCVNLSAANASVNWTVATAGDGLVVRYSVPDGESGSLEVFADNVSVGTLSLTSNYSWEYLATNNDPNSNGVTNTNPKMRFDEVRMKLASQIPTGGNLKLVRVSGNITIDFAELELIPAAIPSTGSVYTGTGSNLQTFINANDGGGNTIFLPPGIYYVNSQIYFDADNTILKGAGMWYTQIHFINNGANQGGLRSNANNISFSGLYLTTVRNSRTASYKAINGAYTNGATITNIWAEHFECGAWIAQYNNGPSPTNGLTVSNCRFRNNYADGINLCKGTRNTIVEHCSFRNNGDDDMAIWSSDGLECRDNTYRYNTSENCWRASGCAIYGGYNNKAHHLLIRDNLEVGLRVNNSFPGIGFNDNGMHEFSDITIIRCGTFNDLFNSPVGAIDISSSNTTAGTRVKNVKFSNISITDSKNDAIYINKRNGEGFYNLVFENISINGTGKEYPNNNANGLNWGRGYGILFVGNPTGFGSYCNLTYANRGGNAATNINNTQIGTFSWANAGCGTVVTSPLSGAVFGECDTLITITANADLANGTIDSIEFFVDGTKVGRDVSAPYSFDWKNFKLGSHQIYVRSNHSPSGSAISSTVEEVTVTYFKGLIYTASAPVIDGSIDALWAGYTAAVLEKNPIGSVRGYADLSATFKINYDSTNLYLLVDVTDDNLQNAGGANWQKDGLEVFIDIGNDKNDTYGADDYTYNFVYGDPAVYETQHTATAGVVFAQTVKTGGYIMEVSIPWSTLGTGVVLSKRALIGFDLHVDDNDDDGGAGGRDAKIAWNDCKDAAWQNPSSFGTLEESGCTTTSSPIGFINFQASIIGGRPVLEWDTYYKKSDRYFEIQRDDTQSGNFQVITTVSATGTPGVLSAKASTDYSSPSGRVTYRIGQVDVDGCKIMSDTISLGLVTAVTNSKETQAFNFYPNPFHTSGNLQINSGTISHYSISIKDMNGKPVSDQSITGDSPYTIGAGLPPGMYLLEVFDGSTRQTIKLIKL